eukprot:TRINITY_DN5154_c0_g4_i1.p1 TRINITY_DN5154_c0_g4~~TRINITY_DN5154_c0_g4_i1.p1  ORF type:complete len:386 (+),score=45.62 TRINITY_DN5154_c0_g4_i1:211-1368(+)
MISAHKKDYADHRIKCPSCGTEQCIGCGVNPYHLGYTCKEHKERSMAKRCRYCDEPVNAIYHVQTAFHDICNKPDCKERLKNACPTMLACGHPCSGFAGETSHLPCLHADCAERSKEYLSNQTGDDYCNICFTEGLIQAPDVRLKCGHIFHVHCLNKRIETRWHRPRITFNFCYCPLCKLWAEVPPEYPLAKVMAENKALYDDIRKKARERLRFEDMEKDPKIITPGSPWYNRPIDFALATFSYYLCFKCKKPYFGGKKNCELAMEEEKQGVEGFKAEELVCSNCCDVGVHVQNCQTHGKDYIEFKCRFCCSVATWFCWGTTHFCEPCHKRQCNGDHVSKYTKDKLPKCTSKEACPLKVAHPPNGEEFALGCGACRNIKENARDF